MEGRNWKDEKGYKCRNCKRTFSTKYNLQVHYKTHLDKNLRDTVSCHHCGKNFLGKRNLTRHLSICNKNNQNNSKAQVHQKVKCAMCPYEDFQVDVLKHYNQQHDIEIVTESITFNSFDEFEKWKDETEKTSISKYTRHDSRKSSSKTHYYYRCHRDGLYKKYGKNIRHLKVKGSNKINGFCPSKLTVTVENRNGHVSVKFVKTHVGHQMDLARIPLGKSERNILASKLSLDVPFDEILSSVKENADANTVKRLNLLTRKDLYNIKLLRNIKNSKRHANDCVSVQAWMKEMQETSCDSVVRFYKGHGEDSESLYSDLQKEDFLLIIMNDAQMEILKTYGNYCICIDTTHGHSFELTTLLVLDDSGQAFPCLFTFSNRSDTVIFKIIFKVLRNELDFPLTPTVFMSDVAENCYNAWCEVMGPVDYRLFCSWHVLRAWKNIYSKIKNTDKRSSVQNILGSLLEQSDESVFERMLDDFIDCTESDAELKEIGHYLRDNYYLNRKSWAYCYRKHTGLNTNTHSERMQSTLKCIYSKGNTEKRLDEAINAIMTLVRNELYNKVEVSTKLSALRHQNMDEIKDKPIIEERDGNWVMSSATGHELCKIQKANLSCKCEVKCTKCDTCIHGYTCSCPDSAVQWNMCKHIHLLCQSGLTNTRPNLTSEENNLYMDCDSTIAIEEPASRVSPKTNNISAVDLYKKILHEMFESAMAKATTMEQCRIIHETVAPLVSRLAAMASPQSKEDARTIKQRKLVETKKCRTKIFKQPEKNS